MKTRVNTLLAIAGLAAVGLLTLRRTLPPSPLPADAPQGKFSARRAIRHVQAVGRDPHPTGSAANAAVRSYILEELKALGMQTETQEAGDLENVMGKIAGVGASDAILLTAHLDSVAESPGAADDGIGVAVLLETARALVSGPRLRNTVMFLFTDKEEAGLYGAKAFIASHPWAKDVRIVIGFDAGGLRGPAVLAATSPNNGWLIGQLARADPYLTGSSAINALADSGTDFGHAFKPAGFSGYAFDLYWDRRNHTPEDNIGNLSLSSLQHQGDHALALARHFGNLEKLADPKEPDAVYFSVLRLYTVVYSPAGAIALAIGVSAILWSLLASGLRRGMLAWRGMGLGGLVWVGGLLVAPLPGILLGRWGSGVPLRYFGRLLDQPAQVAGVAVFALALTMLWYSVARKLVSMSIPDLTMGALMPAWAGMVVTTFIFPALSFALAWPLLFSSLACANWFHRAARQEISRTVVPGVLLSAAATIVVLGPTLILGLFDQMPLALVLMGVLCGFAIPPMQLIGEWNMGYKQG